jgi:hypothetical protein
MDMKKLGENGQKWGFWILLLILVGCLIGAYGTTKYHNTRLKEATIVGGMIVDGQSYDVTQHTGYKR